MRAHEFHKRRRVKEAQAVAGTALMSSIEVVGVVWDIIFTEYVLNI